MSAWTERVEEPTLGNLIAALEAAPPDATVPFGFNEPHSYRGYYEDLAFEPAENVRVADMLTEAKVCLGRTFEGYKGGNYKMDGWSRVWLARYSEATGETLGPRFVRLLLGSVTPPDAAEPRT